MKKENNSKSVQLALVIALVIIWGAVVYQFKSYKEPGLQFTSKEFHHSIVQHDVLKDSFVLLANYRDPFLSNKIQRPQKQFVSSSLNHQTIMPKVDKIDLKNNTKKTFPKTKYSAFSLNDKNIKRALLSVNGSQKSLKVNERFEEIRVIGISRDSVILMHGNDRKVVYRNR